MRRKLESLQARRSALALPETPFAGYEKKWSPLGIVLHSFEQP